QARATHLWEANAVVDDVDHNVVVFARGNNINTPLAGLTCSHGLDRFGCVLDDVGQRLRNQPAVKLRPHWLVPDLGFDIEVGMANPHQEHGLAHGIGDVLAFYHRLWHPRETRELVDHPPDVVDLTHDRLGALLEHRLVLGD